MSHHVRRYVSPSGEMYRAIARYSGGRSVSAGPYTTKAAALRMRKSLSRPGAVVTVEVCYPEWQPIEGTEL